MDTPVPYYDDEIDLREFIFTLLKGWKLILLFTLLGGVAALVISKLQQPVYETSAQVLIFPSVSPATAQFLISPDGTPVTISPAVFLLSDAVRQKSADSLGLAVSKIPPVSIAADKTNTTLFTITAQAASAQKAMQVANAWAEAGIAYMNVSAQLPLAQEAQARSALEAADRALVDYQQHNGLDQLTWADLQDLTGIGLANNVLAPGGRELPNISPSQRLEIAKLMQARLDAQTEYETIRSLVVQTKYNLAANPPLVIKYAPVPKAPIKPKLVVNTLLGALAGALLAMSWIILRGWLRQSTDNSKNRPS